MCFYDMMYYYTISTPVCVSTPAVSLLPKQPERRSSPAAGSVKLQARNRLCFV